MAGRAAAAPRGPCGPWLCLLVALALDVVRGQREGRGGAGRGAAGPRLRPGARDTGEPGACEFSDETQSGVSPHRALRVGEVSAPVLAHSHASLLLPSLA